MSSTLRIAITGGLGSGKSIVATKFQELGIPIIDSDIIARDIVKPGSPCLNAIITEFNTDILADDGTLNRDELRNIIFNNDSAKQRLEEILHPVIYQKIETQLSIISSPYCLIVIPLLIETRSMDRFDRILVVDTEVRLQIQRTIKRDKLSIEMVENIIQKQVSRELRLKYADDIIINNTDLTDLNKSVFNLHNKYLELSKLKHRDT